MKILLLVLSGLLVTPLARARECSAPPVRSSDQAVCYATAYAEKNRLPNGRSFRKSVAKGKTAWTVRAIDTRQDSKGAGWEVDVDVASGTVTRFKGYKGSER